MYKRRRRCFHFYAHSVTRVLSAGRLSLTQLFTRPRHSANEYTGIPKTQQHEESTTWHDAVRDLVAEAEREQQKRSLLLRDSKSLIEGSWYAMESEAYALSRTPTSEA
jgi:hypothetical protein